MAESVALVTLLAASSVASVAVRSATTSVGLRTLSSEVAYPVTPVADRPTTTTAPLLAVLSCIGTLPGKVTSPGNIIRSEEAQSTLLSAQ